MEEVIVLYGATGYTGVLIAKEAKRRGLDILLCGRNEQKLKALSEETGFKYLAVDLHDQVQLEEVAVNADIILHAAGPFSGTVKPMIEACLKGKAHYLDITGEIDVFQYLNGLHHQAKEAGIVVLPGVGFDVVPTDCLALYLKNQMHDAKELTLWIGGMNKVSPGTAKTGLEAASQKVRVRRGGVIEFLEKPLLGTKDFGDGEKKTISIGWGDVSTAYYTTRIPDVTVFFPMSRGLEQLNKSNAFKRWVMSLKIVQNWLKKKVEKRIKGPTEQQRETGRAVIYGEVKNEKGEAKEAKLTTPEGYTLTAKASVLIIEKLLKSKPDPGFYTPAGLFGSELVMELENVEREDIK